MTPEEMLRIASSTEELAEERRSLPEWMRKTVAQVEADLPYMRTSELLGRLAYPAPVLELFLSDDAEEVPRSAEVAVLILQALTAAELDARVPPRGRR